MFGWQHPNTFVMGYIELDFSHHLDPSRVIGSGVVFCPAAADTDRLLLFFSLDFFFFSSLFQKKKPPKKKITRRLL